MKRWLMLLGVLGSPALIAANAASATVTYDSATRTWFIGRGDVIAYVGKAALIERPRVDFYVDADYTATCVFNDGTRVATTGHSAHWEMHWAEPRHAPGNGTITGYTTGPIFTGMDSSFFACESTPANSSGFSVVDVKVVSYTQRLTFEGVEIPAPYLGP